MGSTRNIPRRAAYAKALKEMTWNPVTEAWAVRFGKASPEFEVRKTPALELTLPGLEESW